MFVWFLEFSVGFWKFLGVRDQCLEALNTLALNVWRVQNTRKTHTENAWKYSRISGIVSCDFLFFWLVLATQNMDLTTQQRLAAKLCGGRPCRDRGCRAQTGTPRPRGPPQTPQQRHAARTFRHPRRQAPPSDIAERGRPHDRGGTQETETTIQTGLGPRRTRRPRITPRAPENKPRQHTHTRTHGAPRPPRIHRIPARRHIATSFGAGVAGAVVGCAVWLWGGLLLLGGLLRLRLSSSKAIGVAAAGAGMFSVARARSPALLWL